LYNVLYLWLNGLSITHLLGILGILWSCLWFFMVTNSPSEHPKISRKELNYIERSLKGESEAEVGTVYKTNSNQLRVYLQSWKLFRRLLNNSPNFPPPPLYNVDLQ
jgi:hypothetical protein